MSPEVLESELLEVRFETGQEEAQSESICKGRLRQGKLDGPFAGLKLS